MKLIRSAKFILILALIGAAVMAGFVLVSHFSDSRSAAHTAQEIAEMTTGRVNLNTASAEELEALPGIGEELAGRISAYREEHGGFRAVEELKQVSGIGDSLYDSIKWYVVIQ